MRLALLLALLSAGCLRKTEFQCSNDSSCGAGGVCEPSSYCSFVDGECASGRRYGASAGTLADQCVGGPGDGGVDTGDAGVDTSPGACPAGYDALPGVPGHLYKLVTVGDDWQGQQTACRQTTLAAHLAIPDDATELMALDTLAGAITNYWVGITDSGLNNEGTWRTVLNTPQTFLPWQPPAPDDNAGGLGEDCVEALTALHRFNDRRCNQSLPAICECTP